MKSIPYYILLIFGACLLFPGCVPAEAPPAAQKSETPAKPAPTPSPAAVIEGVKNKVDDLQEKIQKYNNSLESLIQNPDAWTPPTDDSSATTSAASTTSEPNEPEDADETNDDDLDLTAPPPGYIDEEDMRDDTLMEPLDLGEILGEDPENLVRLDEKMAIWVDKEKSKVVLQGWICQTHVPLEFFLCTGKGFMRTFTYLSEDGTPEKMMMFLGAKTHESVVCVDVRPNLIHTALLAVGAKPGEHVIFYPEFKPATGDEIEITLRWLDANKNIVERRGQDVVKDAETGEAMDVPWVFAGSMFYEDEDGGRYYAADSAGEIVGVSNFPSSTLDVPQASSSENAELLFISDREKLPELGTPVTILLRRKAG